MNDSICLKSKPHLSNVQCFLSDDNYSYIDHSPFFHDSVSYKQVRNLNQYLVVPIIQVRYESI